MRVETRKIGPEEAQELLGLNTHNRPVRSSHAARLAADMTHGDWRDGGAILLADDGGKTVLLDGQHRLLAVIRAEATVEFVVISGLSLDDQPAIDTGIRRTLADVLHLRGEKNCRNLAAAIGWRWRRSLKMYRSSQTPTIAQGLAVLEDHPGLRECFTTPRRAVGILRLPMGMCVALYYEQLGIDAEDADAFWDMLHTGIIPSQKHPIWHLRNRLEENAAASYKNLDALSMAALIIKAWNAYRDGREISQLHWRKGGASPEPFPEMK